MTKQRFPLLEQLRADYRREEEEISAPYKREIQLGAEMIGSLRRRLRAIEQALGTEAAKEMMECLTHELSRKILELAYKAAAGADPAKPVAVYLPPEVIRFSDPRSIEAEIVRLYRLETLPRLSLAVDEIPYERVTVVDIRVPELGFRHRVASH